MCVLCVCAYACRHAGRHAHRHVYNCRCIPAHICTQVSLCTGGSTTVATTVLGLSLESAPRTSFSGSLMTHPTEGTTPINVNAKSPPLRRDCTHARMHARTHARTHAGAAAAEGAAFRTEGGGPDLKLFPFRERFSAVAVSGLLNSKGGSNRRTCH